MTAVTAGPHHIDVRARDAFHAHGSGQGSPGGVGQFQRAFSLHAQPHEEAPGLGRRQSAVHERPEAAGRHVRRQVFPPRQVFQHLGHAAVPSLPGQDGLREIAQQAQPVRRQDGFGVKLHAHPWPVAILQGHDLAFRGAGRHREQRIALPFSGMDHQRMIAGHLHGIGQTFEQAAAVVHDLGLLAVHDAGPHIHPRPGVQAQQLMAQADAQHRYMVRKPVCEGCPGPGEMQTISKEGSAAMSRMAGSSLRSTTGSCPRA